MLLDMNCGEGVLWEQLLLGKCRDDMWESFKGQILKTQDQCVPVRRRGKEGQGMLNDQRGCKLW